MQWETATPLGFAVCVRQNDCRLTKLLLLLVQQFVHSSGAFFDQSVVSTETHMHKQAQTISDEGIVRAPREHRSSESQAQPR